jgi:hypothetical protein
MRVIERGYLAGRLVFQQPHEISEAEAGNLATRHASAMIEGLIDMVELEFPDCPPEDRFFRIGMNPDGMVAPIALNLSRKN